MIQTGRLLDYSQRYTEEVEVRAAATAQARSGSGRRGAMEAIRGVDYPIAWLPPDPGTGGGVSTSARQRENFGFRTFWIEDATSGSR
jgi:hypothetical protein